jgi:hypothetical protein
MSDFDSSEVMAGLRALAPNEVAFIDDSPGPISDRSS